MLFRSQPSIQIAKKKHSVRGRTKHMDVRYKYVQHVISSKRIEILKVDTKDNVADVLTKPVNVGDFCRHAQRIVQV